jgi:hypothetical protein
MIAAAGLGTAALAWWMAWPASTALAVLLIGAVGLIVYLLLALRTHAVSDALASAIDEEAGLDGELRSASWFAARDLRDVWADEHVVAAAGRLEDVDWKQIYPAVRARRSAVMTAGLTIAALALATMFPERGFGPTPAAAMLSERQTVQITEPLPAELLRQLEQLLAAAEAGDHAALQALSRSASLRDRLNELARLSDPQLLEALARALATGPAADQQTADAMEALAERARRAAEAAGMSAEMRDALEQLAGELEIVTPDQVASSADPGGAEAAGADPAAAGASGALEQLTIRFAEENTAGGGGGVMLLSNLDGADGGGAPGTGVGGAPSGDIPDGAMAEIRAALGREIVAAHEDAPGGSVEAELHRQTEQGRAGAAFTRSIAVASDSTPVVSPPAVPEARRSGIRTYFVRPPQ